MKVRYYFLSVALIGPALVGQVTLAETTISTTTNRADDNLRERLDQRLASTSSEWEERRDALVASSSVRQELRTERQAVLRAELQQRVLNLSANISNRMEAAISRIFNIIDRLEIRITKLREAGINTTASESKLREASQLLAEARQTLSSIDESVYDATTSTEPQNRWQEVRQIYQTAGSQIRQSHQALRDCVALLKTAVATAQNNPSADLPNESNSTSTNNE